METSDIVIHSKRITQFRKKILGWYKTHQRILPWRGTGNPYHVLVSEFMLQQTQVGRVIPFFTNWISEFPTIESLASAGQDKVTILWNGLGYNCRAVRLKNTAEIICKDCNGIIPSSYDTLKKLPGIGDYMASSIPAFAYNKTVPVIDINIRRVLITEFGLPPQSSNDSLKPLALACIPRNKSMIWHSALMDYGAAMHNKVKKTVPPLTKQSKFAGSFRELRGSIIRLLIQNGSMSVDSLEHLIDDPRLPDAMEAMLKEKLIRRHGNLISL